MRGDFVDGPRTIIVCPMEFERRALDRAGLSRRFDLRCCGLGANAIERWMTEHVAVDRPVILAGLAGALSDGRCAGEAFVIGEVVSADRSRRWRPTLSLSVKKPAGDAVVVTSTDRAVKTVGEKQGLRDCTGADLVDLESVAFAEVATRRGNSWAVVRGVSDDAETALPEGIERWVDEHGRPRLSAVLASLATHPHWVPKVMRLRSASAKAMRNMTELFKSVDAEQ